MKRFTLLVIILILSSVLLVVGLRYWFIDSGESASGLVGAEDVGKDNLIEPTPYPTKKLTDNGVTFAITPLQLSTDNKTATFAVTINTHSVELDYDLAKLATLQLDEGVSIPAISWDGNQGGHHVSGTLTFPNVEIAGVNAVSMVIREVADVPTWIFTWQLQ